MVGNTTPDTDTVALYVAVESAVVAVANNHPVVAYRAVYGTSIALEYNNLVVAQTVSYTAVGSVAYSHGPVGTKCVVDTLPIAHTPNCHPTSPNKSAPNKSAHSPALPKVRPNIYTCVLPPVCASNVEDPKSPPVQLHLV